MLLTGINVLFGQHVKCIFYGTDHTQQSRSPRGARGLPSAPVTSQDAPRSSPRSLGPDDLREGKARQHSYPHHSLSHGLDAHCVRTHNSELRALSLFSGTSTTPGCPYSTYPPPERLSARLLAQSRPVFLLALIMTPFLQVSPPQARRVFQSTR